MAPICANKSDRKSYMNEIDGFSVLLTSPKPKANRSRKRRQFDDFSLLQGVASLRPIHPYKTACTTTRICSMCFAREENAITRKWQNQKHCPSIRRNMQALPPRKEWPCCNGATKTDWKNIAGTQAKVQGLQKGARQLKSRKPLRKTQGQARFLDRRVRNMENRRGPSNRRIRRYSILQQLNFGDTSYLIPYITMVLPKGLPTWMKFTPMLGPQVLTMSNRMWPVAFSMQPVFGAKIFHCSSLFPKQPSGEFLTCMNRMVSMKWKHLVTTDHEKCNACS